MATRALCAAWTPSIWTDARSLHLFCSLCPFPSLGPLPLALPVACPAPCPRYPIPTFLLPANSTPAGLASPPRSPFALCRLGRLCGAGGGGRADPGCSVGLSLQHGGGHAPLPRCTAPPWPFRVALEVVPPLPGCGVLQPLWASCRYPSVNSDVETLDPTHCSAL